MSDETTDTCVDPQVGRLLADELSGALTAPGREADHKRFGDHYKKCRKCREAMLDHVNETVVIPFLKELAKERGVTFEELFDVFLDEVEIMKDSGKLRSKWD